jgi:hypothetical protein
MKKLILLFALIVLMCSCAWAQTDSMAVAKAIQQPKEQLANTVVQQQQELKDCSEEVRNYADSVKAIWKAKHTEMDLARQKWFWGEDKTTGKAIDWVIYLIAEFVALLSVFASTFIITVPRGVKTNTVSPNSFSIKYWWINNKEKLYRWISILIFIFFACRLSNEYFNSSLNFLYAVGLGAGLDQLITWWKNYNQKRIDAFNKTLSPTTPSV